MTSLASSPPLSPRRQSTGVMHRTSPHRHDSNSTYTNSSGSAPTASRRRAASASRGQSKAVREYQQRKQQLVQATSSHGTGTSVGDPGKKDSNSDRSPRSNRDSSRSSSNINNNASASNSVVAETLGSSATTVTTATAAVVKLESIDVIVNVLQGADLAAKDRNWTGEATSSDPYCIVKLLVTSSSGTGEAQEVVLGKTETVKGSLNPKWEERMEVTMGSINPGSKYALQFTIMDEDEFKKDDLMGVVTIPLDASQPVNSTQWYDVPADSAHSATGRLQLALETKFHYSDGSTAVAEAPKPKQKKKQSPERSVKKDVEFLDIDLMVHQGDGLAAKDRNIIGSRTTSDPFVEVILLPDGIPGSRELSLGLTKTIEKTLSPVWQDQFFVRLPISTLSSNAQLRLTIKDHDDFSADDVMGIVHIHLPLKEYCSGNKWYGVPASSARNACGRIQCSLITQRIIINGIETGRSANSEDVKKTEEPAVPVTTAPVVTTSPPVVADGHRNVDSMTVAVTVVAGAGLAAKDRNLVGKRKSSDPYVKVTLLTTPPGAPNDGKEIDMGTTHVVPRSLAPVWNERFEKKLLGPEMLRVNEARLQFAVYDRDLGTKDDCMGVLTIPVPLVNTTPATSNPRWYGIPSHSAKNASGRLQVQVETVIVYAFDQLRRTESPRTASSRRAGLSPKSSVRNLQATARSRDSSAFCTPRRTRNTQHAYKKTAAPIMVKNFSLDDSTRDLNKSISQLGKGMDSLKGSKSTKHTGNSRRVSSPPPSSSKELDKSNSTSMFHSSSSQTHRRASSPPAPTNRGRNMPAGPSSDIAHTSSSTSMTTPLHGGTDIIPSSSSSRNKAFDTTQSRSSSKSRFAHQKARSKDSSAFCTPRRTRPKESVSEASTESAGQANLKSITTPMSPEGVNHSQRSASNTTSELNVPATASQYKSSTEEKKPADESPSIYCTPRRSGPSLKVNTVMSIRLSDSSSTLTETKHANVIPDRTNATDTPAAVSTVPAVFLTLPTKPQTVDASTQTPKLSTLPSSKRIPSTTWTCTCDYESSKTRPFCGMCGTRQFWACGDCDFDSNMCLYKFCGMCGIPKKEKPPAQKSDSSRNNKSCNLTSPVSVRAF